MPNKLIHETSPYLLQHAHNPVQWYPWGAAAFEKAVAEDKPILISIGYAACHWCHVMERESFEDAATAAVMNEHFVNIKIDREERPDIDHIYMDAVQTMAGNGGWPLNVFLTPHKQPFYGGTYFPPKPYGNRPSWQQVLLSVADAYANKKEQVTAQAASLTQHLASINNNNTGNADFLYNDANMHTIAGNILKNADTVWGGFSSAPKFPQAAVIRYLFNYYKCYKNDAAANAKPALEQALRSMDKMMAGGIYDQLGGGFARYATDEEWLAPHFEKMLYDNALLVTTLSEAYQITRHESYKNTMIQTLDFIERELMQGDGFLSALDADSEGEEGRYYVWSHAEIAAIAGADTALYCNYYDITTGGNWEGKNILRVLQPLSAVAEKYGLDEKAALEKIKNINALLLKAREKRVRPGLDDKLILGWNALMNTAYSKAFAATGIEKYKMVAVANMHFLLQIFKTAGGGFKHVYKNNEAKYNAYLDDLAYLTEALLTLHHITADTAWLHEAEEIIAYIFEHFSGELLFHFTPHFQQDVIIKKVEIYDGATPSGNAVMAANLHRLGILLGRQEWVSYSQRMCAQLSGMIIKYPTSFGAWAQAALAHTKGMDEIVFIGNYQNALQQFLQTYQPLSVIMAAPEADEKYPLLKGKTNSRDLSIYLCRNYSCMQPEHSIGEVLKALP